MKKSLLTTAAILLALCLNAQVSVWDGTAEPWTNGSGTEDDPYLIENAQNMAYLANAVNEGADYANEYFLLTTDLDLGSEIEKQWIPVGNSDGKCFSGHFDGGSRKVFNISILRIDDNYVGLFGNAKSGSIRNIVIEKASGGEQYYIFHTGTSSGLLLGYGDNIVLENCVNNANVEWQNDVPGQIDDKIGGLFGFLRNSAVRDCRNYGRLRIQQTIDNGIGYFGGVAGAIESCEIALCCNKGDILVLDCNEDYVSEGGIVGYASTDAVISNCYNVSDIRCGGSTYSYAGGIVGFVDDDTSASVVNCYYAGTMEAIHNCGIIAHPDEQTAEINVTNSYYLYNTVTINYYGIPKSESAMKSEEFVNLLNNGENIYAMDEFNLNDGYPIFADEYDFIGETAQYNGISVYPNPASGIISVSFDDNANCHSVEIFSLDGRLVKSQNANFNAIDISSLAPGLYMLKVRMRDGREYNERIVKE